MFSDNDTLVKTVRKGFFPAEICRVTDMTNDRFSFELSVMVGRQPGKKYRIIHIPVRFIAKNGNILIPLWPDTFYINREDGALHIRFFCVKSGFFQTFGIDNPRKYVFSENGFLCSADIVDDPANVTVYI